MGESSRGQVQEQELLEAARRGDETAYRDLVEPHRGELLQRHASDVGDHEAYASW